MSIQNHYKNTNNINNEIKETQIFNPKNTNIENIEIIFNMIICEIQSTCAKKNDQKKYSIEEKKEIMEKRLAEILKKLNECYVNNN